MKNDCDLFFFVEAEAGKILQKRRDLLFFLYHALFTGVLLDSSAHYKTSRGLCVMSLNQAFSFDNVK